MKDWRTLLVLCFLLIFGGCIILRLGYLQIVKQGYYKALANGQQTIPNLKTGDRGTISIGDKTGELHIMATNQESPFVFATTPEIKDKKTAAKLLSSILQISETVLEEKFADNTNLFSLLKRRLTQKEEQAVLALALPGIHIEKETIRFYPKEELAGRALGFVNQDGNGQYGIEDYYQNDLAGKEGLQKTIRNIAGYLLGQGSTTTAENGKDIELTLDINIQSIARDLLKKAAQDLTIQEGSIVVMNPQTGSIMAMANYPEYNPNEYAKIKNQHIFQNPVIESVFEPGSVFKPITMAAGIDAGAITPTTTYTDKGIVRVGGYKVLNYGERIWGERTMTEVLEYSINTGAVFAEATTGHQTFMDYIEKFGMFVPTGVDLAGEVYSQNKELKKGYEINYTTASFGQGIEITPIQLMKAYTAFANQGKMVSPRITTETPKFSQQIISPQTASQVTSMLVNVIENGFSKKAKIPGYYIAGKTGTAQVAFSTLGENKAGYSNQTIQSFIGYAPAFNPQFLILVKLGNPTTKTAEYSAMPLFRELAKYIIDYLQIPPDYEIKQ